MTVDVVVPSYHRPDLLERCLLALDNQSRLPDRVIVVARRDDDETQRVVERHTGSKSEIVGLVVDEPGVIAAMTVGVAGTVSDVIAFTDDDAEPRSDWLAGLVGHFDDPSVGGVGGRDVVMGQEGPLSPDVGRVTWYGKLVGNHHLGCGGPRSVHVLKGVNMAFRADALALPRAGMLRGWGAQAHFEVLVSGYARRQGWRLVYDPAILVDHEIGRRTGADARWRPRPGAVLDAAFNATLSARAVSEHWWDQRALYGFIVGSRGEPGLGRSAAALVRREREVARRAVPSIAGHTLGLIRALRGMDVEDITVSATALRTSTRPSIGQWAPARSAVK